MKSNPDMKSSEQARKIKPIRVAFDIENSDIDFNGYRRGRADSPEKFGRRNLIQYNKADDGSVLQR